MQLAKAAWSTGTSSSLANMIRIKSSGRGKLPVCVVRKPVSLRFIAVPSQGEHQRPSPRSPRTAVGTTRRPTRFTRKHTPRNPASRLHTQQDLACTRARGMRHRVKACRQRIHPVDQGRDRHTLVCERMQGGREATTARANNRDFVDDEGSQGERMRCGYGTLQDQCAAGTEDRHGELESGGGARSFHDYIGWTGLPIAQYGRSDAKLVEQA